MTTNTNYHRDYIFKKYNKIYDLYKKIAFYKSIKKKKMYISSIKLYI